MGMALQKKEQEKKSTVQLNSQLNFTKRDQTCTVIFMMIFGGERRPNEGGDDGQPNGERRRPVARGGDEEGEGSS
jgi:hypothetical protein